MKPRNLLLLVLPVVFGVCSTVFAGQGDPISGYKLLTTINLPGGLTGNDISWVDSANARYYLADRGNATATPPVPARVDVIDTEHDQFVTSINLSTGANGIVSIPRAHEVWVGLNDSTVAIINADTNTVTGSISTAAPRERMSWRMIRRTTSS